MKGLFREGLQNGPISDGRRVSPAPQQSTVLAQGPRTDALTSSGLTRSDAVRRSGHAW
jgi:hypothetical protein